MKFHEISTPLFGFHEIEKSISAKTVSLTLYPVRQAFVQKRVGGAKGARRRRPRCGAPVHAPLLADGRRWRMKLPFTAAPAHGRDGAAFCELYGALLRPMRCCSCALHTNSTAIANRCVLRPFARRVSSHHGRAQAHFCRRLLPRDGSGIFDVQTPCCLSIPC